MGWLAETPWVVPAAFGEYGGFGRIGGASSSEHSGRVARFGPVVYMLDETAFLLVFTSTLATTDKLFAWPGDIAPDGTATLRDPNEVIEVLDLTGVLTTPFIEAIEALPGGGYAVYVGGSGVG